MFPLPLISRRYTGYTNKGAVVVLRAAAGTAVEGTGASSGPLGSDDPLTTPVGDCDGPGGPALVLTTRSHEVDEAGAVVSSQDRFRRQQRHCVELILQRVIAAKPALYVHAAGSVRRLYVHFMKVQL